MPRSLQLEMIAYSDGSTHPGRHSFTTRYPTWGGLCFLLERERPDTKDVLTTLPSRRCLAPGVSQACMGDTDCHEPSARSQAAGPPSGFPPQALPFGPASAAPEAINTRDQEPAKGTQKDAVRRVRQGPGVAGTDLLQQIDELVAGQPFEHGEVRQLGGVRPVEERHGRGHWAAGCAKRVALRSRKAGGSPGGSFRARRGPHSSAALEARAAMSRGRRPWTPSLRPAALRSAPAPPPPLHPGPRCSAPPPPPPGPRCSPPPASRTPGGTPCSRANHASGRAETASGALRKPRSLDRRCGCPEAGRRPGRNILSESQRVAVPASFLARGEFPG